jgi:hypothetical protein
MLEPTIMIAPSRKGLRDVIMERLLRLLGLFLLLTTSTGCG